MRQPIVWQYRLLPSEIEVLTKSCQLAAYGGGGKRVSPLFAEEIEEMIQRLAEHWREGEWMYRLDNASSKDANVGRPPFTTPAAVIKSLATSGRCYANCFQPEHVADNRTLYFSHYDRSWRTTAEWRCFIYEGQVIAISQHDIFNCCPLLNAASDEILQALGKELLAVIEKLLATVLLGFQGPNKAPTITLDFYYDLQEGMDRPPQIIEMNYYYYCGASLFNWTELAALENLPSSNNRKIPLRIVTASP